jgi:rhodanese-related sulfurtransferase
MQLLPQAAILIACSLLGAAGTHLLHPRTPAWYLSAEPLSADEVTYQMVQEKWQGHVLWIDARPRDQYDQAHAPGALLLNEQEADALMFEHFEKLQDNTKPVVVYCGQNACQASRKMAEYLKERIPIAEIYVLRGGWDAMQNKRS